MSDFFRIFVLWSPGSSESRRLANLIAKHFDGLGMERDGVAFRIPVRFRCQPWVDGSPSPRPIDLTEAEHNAIVFLHDDFSHAESGMWGGFISDVKASMALRGNKDVYIPFGSPTGERALHTDASHHIQYARRDAWLNNIATRDARDSRLLLHMLFKIRQHLRAQAGDSRVEPLFVSHAKLDGDRTARRIIDYVNSTNNDVPIHVFYDAKELSPGDDFEAVFEKNIGHGTLLALVSDAYDSRPWCVYEITTAKRANRPVLLADIGMVRISRTYPYGANLPKVRVDPSVADDDWIETLLVQTLSEGIRCDLFLLQAERQLKRVGEVGATVLPRPPELFDLIDKTRLGHLVVYPDPPLGVLESEILNKAISMISATFVLKTLSEIR